MKSLRRLSCHAAGVLHLELTVSGIYVRIFFHEVSFLKGERHEFDVQ